MKLKEFLKQFENLDPELEVFQHLMSGINAVSKDLPKVKISYVHSKHIDIAFDSDQETVFYDKKAIVLY